MCFAEVGPWDAGGFADAFHEDALCVGLVPDMRAAAVFFTFFDEDLAAVGVGRDFRIVNRRSAGLGGRRCFGGFGFTFRLFECFRFVQPDVLQVFVVGFIVFFKFVCIREGAVG